MLRRLAPLAAALACIGCSNQAAAPGESLREPASDAQPNPNQPVKLSGSGEPGTIGIFHNGAAIHVGDPWEISKTVYPAPRTAYDLHDLPQSIPNNYEAHGWETPSGEGFGSITLNGKIVVAMYQLEKTKQDTFDDALKEQQVGMGSVQPQIISGRSVHFWFWHDTATAQSLMVCELSTTKGINATIAIGDDGILAKDNISEASARREVTLLEAAQNQNPAPPIKN